jgi:hypothetical protein
MAIAARTVTDEDIQQQEAAAHARSRVERQETERVASSAPSVTEVENHLTVRP